MKPAFSVLFFTVTSGIGYGLLIWLLMLQILHGEIVYLPLLLVAGFIGLGFATLGLLSSTLHLANPKNAWRAFSRFRTSWLSREGVFAVLFYPVILLYAYLLYIANGEMNWLALVIGVVAIAIALATVYSTGMIYASLKPIRQWHHPLVTPIYLLLSLSSGALALLLIETLFFSDQPSLYTGRGAIVFLVVAAISALVKLWYFQSIGKPEGLSIDKATGFSQAQVRLLDAGHNAGTFLSKEFVFQVEAKKLFRLRWVALGLAFLVPILLTMLLHLFGVSSLAAMVLILAAFISMYAGLLVERWLFFAEARHVVRLYHGDQRT